MMTGQGLTMTANFPVALIPIDGFEVGDGRLGP
jgi:hypothetical protein